MTLLPAGHLAGAGFGAPQLLNANAGTQASEATPFFERLWPGIPTL
jgi:hypothetical protein